MLTTELTEAEAADDAMATRRLEDERFAYYAEAAVVFLDLPDAVFRGYAGDAELLGSPRDGDEAPYELLRREIARLEPQKVYFPLGVGGHVDHRLARDAGRALLQRAAGVGDARTRLGGDRRRSTRTSRTPGGAASARLADLGPETRWERSLPTCRSYPSSPT